VRTICDRSCVVVFHDVALCGMIPAWESIATTYREDGFTPYAMAFTQFGVGVAVRGIPTVEKYLAHVAGDFLGHHYCLGRPMQTAYRPRIWAMSPAEVEARLRLKIRRLLHRG